MLKTALAANASCSPNLNVALTPPMNAAAAMLEKRIVDVRNRSLQRKNVRMECGGEVDGALIFFNLRTTVPFI